jgi:hypothetical protein
MNKLLPLLTLVVCAGAVQAQSQEASGPSVAAFFQFTAAVPSCPVPLGPPSSVTADAADGKIAAALRAAVFNPQMYTHSPLVNSSLWATVQSRTVTIEGCIAGDAYTSFDHDSLRTQIENVGNAIPGVERTVVLVRTSVQARAGLPVPYRAQP